MAAMMKYACASHINKGKPSSFYDTKGKENPVIQALERELEVFCAFIKKKNSPGYKPGPNEASSRA